MDGNRVVTCHNCKHAWTLDADTSLFFQLDLCTRPCPVCEAYTLAFLDDQRPRRRHVETATQR